MTKIEERAKAAYPTYNGDVAINRMNACKRLGYIHGSTDQLRIIIERADKWLFDAVMSGYIDASESSASDLVRAFNKAMTHEI